MTELLRQLASSKRNPEFASEVRELLIASQHAGQMLKSGKLSKDEFEDFEAHLYAKYIDALPIDDFQEMMEDGRLDQLRAIAGHDDQRNGLDADEERAAVSKKVTLDALDDAWLNQKIDSQRYAEECRILGTSEDLDNRLADGDYDGVASEFFAERHDVSDHGNDLLNYLKDKYGDAPSPDAPPGRVERERLVDMPSSTKVPSLEGIIDLDAEEAA